MPTQNHQILKQTTTIKQLLVHLFSPNLDGSARNLDKVYPTSTVPGIYHTYIDYAGISSSVSKST